MAYTADSVDFSAFNPIPAEYGPRDIKAEAVYVSQDNIGKFSLEFEKDIRYINQTDPFIEFMAEREGDKPIKLTIKPGVWIIKIWSELHIFRDDLFRKTFELPSLKMPVPAEKVEIRTENLTGNKVAVREGVYDQLSDEAKSVFGPVEKVVEQTKIEPVVGSIADLPGFEGAVFEKGAPKGVFEPNEEGGVTFHQAPPDYKG